MESSDRTAALIVEDQPIVGLVASDILKEAGFETFHAYDAAEAFRLLSAHPEIGVIVTELRLPGDVDGIELSRRVSVERPQARIVVTSAGDEPMPDSLPTAIRVLRKPYASAELKMLAAASPVLQDA